MRKARGEAESTRALVHVLPHRCIAYERVVADNAIALQAGSSPKPASGGV